MSSSAVNAATIRPFSSLLPDVSTMVVVSRSRRHQGPTPEEVAARIREEARQQGLLEGYGEGLKEGHEAGYKKGRDEAYEHAYAEFTEANRELMSRVAVELDRAVAQVNEQIPKWFERAESSMTALTMDILRRLMASELEMTRSHTLHIVKEALSDVTHAQHIRIRLNPFDSVIVAQHRDELMAAASNLRDIEFVDDPDIEGGCVIESDGGVVDARVDVRLALIDEDFAA